MTQQRSIQDIAAEAAEITAQKSVSYGDSFGRSGDILRILFPTGIAPERMDDALAIARVIDKLFRLATQPDAFGESPWLDVLGYALLGVRNRERRMAASEGLVTEVAYKAVYVEPKAIDAERKVPVYDVGETVPAGRWSPR